MTFKQFKTALQENFKAFKQEQRLYETDVQPDQLWETYLNAFPEAVRQEYNCNCCRSFIRQYGNVVMITESLGVQSIWNFEATGDFSEVAKKMDHFVRSKAINNVFIAEGIKLGTDSNVSISEKYLGKRWEHLYLEVPQSMTLHADRIPSALGEYRDSASVFLRSLKEISVSALDLVIDLINENGLYRGAEHLSNLKTFKVHKNKFESYNEQEKVNYAWKYSQVLTGAISRIRNTSIGTLLIDVSEGRPFEEAVNAFERMVAPQNYKRPTAVVTKGMLEAAEKTINELGLMNSLARRFAINSDISVNDVLYVYRDKSEGIFAALKDDALVNPNLHKGVQVIAFDEFMKDVLPGASLVEVLVENRHQNNFMSLITAEDEEAPLLFKWGNPFSWSYRNSVADSIKENVKKAGGKVDGVLRFSIQWNQDGKSVCDLDAHCREPNRDHIYYGDKISRTTGGWLDVDMIRPSTIGVENISYQSKARMVHGKYIFSINNYDAGNNDGFIAQIEADGQIFDFAVNRNFKGSLNVCEVDYLKDGSFKVTPLLDSTSNVASTEIWGIGTNKFHKVNMITKSPNFWGDDSVGNEHLFLMIDKVQSDESPRGFFNEFLKGELDTHRKVFETLGNKIRVKPSTDQLSGLGFSSTRNDNVILRISGKRIVRVQF